MKDRRCSRRGRVLAVVACVGMLATSQAIAEVKTYSFLPAQPQESFMPDGDPYGIYCSYALTPPQGCTAEKTTWLMSYGGPWETPMAVSYPGKGSYDWAKATPTELVESANCLNFCFCPSVKAEVTLSCGGSGGKPSEPPAPPDLDNDGIPDAADNCLVMSNPAQIDTDGDGTGDGCDFCSKNAAIQSMDQGKNCDGSDLNDNDKDGIKNSTDNCPNIPNTDQKNLDGDKWGNVCDDDRDGDLVPNEKCAETSVTCSVNGLNVSNKKDNCPDVPNSDQQDSNENGIGDVCDLPDKDGDGVPDEKDNCPDVPNADQWDSDGFGKGDACDKDDDEDKLLDAQDPAPLNPDIDADGLPDGYEVHIFGTSPQIADEDQDGLNDGQEVKNYCDPKKGDTDNDGLTDGEEVLKYTTSPTKKDSDGDGSEDGLEVALASNPKDMESTPIFFFAIVTEFLHDGDQDGDEIDDPFDNCKDQMNGDQADVDGDKIGDACDSFDNRAWDFRKAAKQQVVPQVLGTPNTVKKPAWMMKAKMPTNKRAIVEPGG